MSDNANKIKTWIKLKEHLIDQDNIRAVSRHGNKTRVERILGNDIIVSVPYDKVKALLPSSLTLYSFVFNHLLKP